MTINYTTNRNYPKPDFDTRTWHDQMHQSLDMIDRDITGVSVTVPSTDGSLLTIYSRIGAEVADIPPEVQALQTTGYNNPGDGGGALYWKTIGSTPGGFQSHDGAWWALEKGNINVRQYGAVGNGVGDDTTAIRAAAAALRLAIYTPPGGAGGVLIAAKMVFPPGVYRITGSINLQDIVAPSGAAETRWAVVMDGALLQCECAGKTVFDCLGSSFGTFRGGTFYGHFTSTPAIAIQVGRQTPTDSAASFLFDGISFNGRWSRAAIYNVQSETNTYLHLGVYNWDVNGAAVIIDGCNHLGPITDFVGTTSPTDTQNSCIQNIFVGGQYASRYGAPAVIDLYDCEQLHFFGVYGNGQSSVIRYTAIGNVGSIVRDFYFDIHCEQNVCNVEFQRLGSLGNMTVTGLYIKDIASQASLAVVKIGANVNQLYIHDGEFHTNITTAPLFSSTAYTLGGSVVGNSVSVLQAVDSNLVLSAALGSLGVNGAINKVALVQALTAPRVVTLPPANAVPRGWEFTLIDLIGGISATNTLTVNRAGADTINGGTTAVLNLAFSGLVLIGDGISKWVIKRSIGYAEGTFVPAFSATGCTFSYATQFGTYTKVGNVVVYTLVIALNTSGNTLTANPLSITGLPFAASSNPMGTVQWNGTTANYVNVNGLVSGTTIVIRGAVAAQNSNAVSLNADAFLHATNGTSIRVSGAYTV